MNVMNQQFALRFEMDMEAVTGLMLRSGRAGEFTDSSVERTPDGHLYINGYVLSSLLRRAVGRVHGGAELAAAWGAYEGDRSGVSPLWTESVFVSEKEYLTAVNFGIRVSRELGAVKNQALYSDEIAFPLVPMTFSFTVFFPDRNQADMAAACIRDALAVIDQGVETIGGGWSYGFGRLRVSTARWSVLDLTEVKGRNTLWQQDNIDWQQQLTGEEIEKLRPAVRDDRQWTVIRISAAVADGQLLAIHTDVPEFGADTAGLPDSYVFRRPAFRNGSPDAVPVVTGKAFRQAVLSREIERMLRSTGQGACLDTADRTRQAVLQAEIRHCGCKRCLWFGDTDGGGIISAADARLSDWDVETVNRIQLCEHSMQNIQLFNGEYLTRGKFTMDIVIDRSRPETSPEELEKKVIQVLEQMHAKQKKGPPGWYRLGATSTCTGQLEVTAIEYPFSASQGGGQ
jgi:hypothetical protein